ncbi:lysophospholipid acyltransferase family protein [Nocardioides houyundeii]|uniref:lysophospholipid acyltransferase family protein n=1 Tax=Nocardioides houyundeii TaxID=2045452 RepID=UPI000DF486E9|nr:lysophospholipid acyltransferase family protein [Nocardioides houyundeii]
MIHAELPRSSDRHPPRQMLHRLRPLARAVVRQRYDVRVAGESHVPTHGPALLAANHIGALDGPLLAAFSPRPVHALTKHEMFTGRAGRLLLRSGQIPLNRFDPDPRAIRTCLRVLREDGVVGIFPEGKRGAGDLSRFHHGAAYLALVTGAPVVPVTFLGTRPAGAASSALPRRGDRIDIVFGSSWQVQQQPWPRRREQVLHASALLLEHMRGELDRACALTGRDLPGPLPAGGTNSESDRATDNDPDTGFVKRGTP